MSVCCNGRYKIGTDTDTGAVPTIIELLDATGAILIPRNIITPDFGTDSENHDYEAVVAKIKSCEGPSGFDAEPCDICIITPGVDGAPPVKTSGKLWTFYEKPSPDSDGDGTSGYVKKKELIKAPPLADYIAHYNEDGSLDTESGDRPEFTSGLCVTNICWDVACGPENGATGGGKKVATEKAVTETTKS